MTSIDIHGQDPKLDIPWPLIKGNQAVFIERIALGQPELDILGSHIAKELYLFGARVKTGTIHPEYGELERVEFLIIEKPLSCAKPIDHPLSQHDSVMYSREGEDIDYVCVDMIKKKDIRFLRRPPKWKASEASIPLHNGQFYHFHSQIHLPENPITRQYLTFATTLFLFVCIAEHDELRVQIFTQDTSQQTAEDHYLLESQMMRFDQHHDEAETVLQLITSGSKHLHDYILNHPNVSKHALELLAEHGKTKALKTYAAKKARP